MKNTEALLRCFAATAVAAVSGAFRAEAQSNLTLQPVADTTLHEAFPDNNFGGGSTFTAGGRNMGGRARALLKFDLAGALPSGATILSASLTVTVTAANGPESTFELHRVLADWGEGNGSDFSSGSPGGPGEATWNNRLGPGTPWTTPGGDFLSTISAAAAINAPGQYTFTGPGLVSDLQTWQTQPATNFGWLLRSEDERIAGTIRRFAGRLDANNPPRLEIVFALPATPPVITDLKLTNGLIQFAFAAQSNRTYTVQARESLSGGDWTTVTNFPALPADAQRLFTSPATGAERYFRVATP